MSENVKIIENVSVRETDKRTKRTSKKLKR